MIAFVVTTKEKGEERWFGIPFGESPWSFLQTCRRLPEISLSGKGIPPYKQRKNGEDIFIKYGLPEQQELVRQKNLLNQISRQMDNYVYTQSLLGQGEIFQEAKGIIMGMRDMFIDKYFNEPEIITMWEEMRRNINWVKFGSLEQKTTGITTMAVDDACNLYISPEFVITFGLRAAILEYWGKGKAPSNEGILRIIRETAFAVLCHELQHKNLFHVEISKEEAVTIAGREVTKEDAISAMRQYYDLSNLSDDQYINTKLTRQGLSKALVDLGVNKLMNRVTFTDFNFEALYNRLSNSLIIELGDGANGFNAERLSELFNPEVRLWLNLYNRDYTVLTPTEVTLGMKTLFDRFQVRHADGKGDKAIRVDKGDTVDGKDTPPPPQKPPKKTKHFSWKKGDIYFNAANNTYGVVIGINRDDADASKDSIKVAWDDSGQLGKAILGLQRLAMSGAEISERKRLFMLIQAVVQNIMCKAS